MKKIILVSSMMIFLTMGCKHLSVIKNNALDIKNNALELGQQFKKVGKAFDTKELKKCYALCDKTQKEKESNNKCKMTCVQKHNKRVDKINKE